MFKFPFKAQGSIIGITGSIGAGKGLVTNYLRGKNFEVINFDDVSKEIREKPEVQAKLLKEFGTTDPREIRKKLGTDGKKHMVLSQLVAMPALMETFKRTNELFKHGTPVVFWEAALLVETGTFAGLSGVILVTADETTRLERVKVRDQVDESYIKPLLEQQMSDADKIKKISIHPKHIILENNNSLAEFNAQLFTLDTWISQFVKS